MSYDDEPRNIGDDHAVRAEKRKVLSRWRATPGGAVVGIVHGSSGTWYPLTYIWSTAGRFTYCGIDTKEDTAANRKTLWATNVSFIDAIECPDCQAGYAAWRLDWEARHGAP